MNFGVLIFNGVEELDFVGPWEMLTMWRKAASGPEHCLIVGQSLEPITCAKGLSINPHVSFANCPPLDYLLVPGGQGTRQEVKNPVLIEFVANQAKTCQAVLSVCTGSFLLHAAGLLSGRKATTHWGSLDRLRALGDVTVVEQRFVQDGNVWSAAGVSAGIDLMLAFIASVAGDEAAGKVQFGAEYYPSPIRYGGFENHAQAPAYIKGTTEKGSTLMTRSIPAGWHSVTPRLVAHDVAGLVEFLKQAFAGTGDCQPDMPCQIRIGDSLVMVSEVGVREFLPAFLYLYVEDVNATYERAIKAGAGSLEAPQDMPYGDRRCMLKDPGGNTWQVATHDEEAFQEFLRRRTSQPG